MSLLLLVGCRTTPQASFPLGLMAVSDPAPLREIRDAGFSVVAGSVTASFLDAARREDLGVIGAAEGESTAFGIEGGAGSRAIQALDRHPALRGWYVCDEPDLRKVAPGEVQRLVTRLRQAGARKPTCLTVFNARSAATYAGLTDWLLVDRYPVPWLPLADFAKHVRLARFAAGPSRRVMAVIQAFDWSYYPGQLPDLEGLRPPTEGELRAMSFLALVHGVDGILYYGYDDGRWRLAEHGEVWQGVRRVVDEMRRLEPLLAGERVWRAVSTHYPERGQALNAALDPRIQASAIRVSRDGNPLAAGDYLVAVNSTSEDVLWQFRWPGPDLGVIPELTSDRRLTAVDGWFADGFPAYAVHIYGPFPEVPEGP